MKRRRRKVFLIIVGVLAGIIGILIIFFNLPWSKTKTEFDAKVSELVAEAHSREDIFREEEIAGLPASVRRYFNYCGYIGKPRMSYIEISYRDVDFLFGRDKPAMKIDYMQYDFVDGPNRIAYINSSMYGVPFEGVDIFMYGSGSMKGRLAKQFTLFDQTGKVMDQASLVTFLSEILLLPNAALQDYIEWTEIDDLHAKAAISCYGMTARGVFAFDEDGRLISFMTNDRSAVATDGSSKNMKWSVVFDEYTEVNGIMRPTFFQAIWHYPEGDLVYFDGKGTITEYN